MEYPVFTFSRIVAKPNLRSRLGRRKLALELSVAGFPSTVASCWFLGLEINTMPSKIQLRRPSLAYPDELGIGNQPAWSRDRRMVSTEVGGHGRDFIVGGAFWTASPS